MILALLFTKMSNEITNLTCNPSLSKRDHVLLDYEYIVEYDIIADMECSERVGFKRGYYYNSHTLFPGKQTSTSSNK